VLAEVSQSVVPVLRDPRIGVVDALAGVSGFSSSEAR
jgi:hypothetical protein